MTRSAPTVYIVVRTTVDVRTTLSVQTHASCWEWRSQPGCWGRVVRKSGRYVRTLVGLLTNLRMLVVALRALVHVLGAGSAP